MDRATDADSAPGGELQTLQRRWEQITDVPEPPLSLLNVIEYSLGDQRRAEVYVNRLLRYFLDPNAPHGMGDECLRAFLEGLPEDCEFQEDLYDLSDVRVSEQVTVRGDEEDSSDGESRSPRFVDLVVEVPNEWFLLVEIKFGAGENNLRGGGLSQTELYFRAPRFGGSRKASYESGHYYLYLHPSDEPSANEEGFTSWTWDAFVDVHEDFLTANAPRYPQRTDVQLRELIDDVREITGMSEHQEAEREKIELYLEHYDAITDVTGTFDERWRRFADEWGPQLREVLEVEGREASVWTFRTKDPDWAHIFKTGWWRNTNTLDAIDERDENYDDVRISFIHRLQGNRDVAVGDRTLKFYFRNCGSNDREFVDEFYEDFRRRENEIEEYLPDSAEVTGNRRNMIAATYEIRMEEHDDFFEAYVVALKRAFVDHVVENDELVATIDSVYETSLEVYR